MRQYLSNGRHYAETLFVPNPDGFFVVQMNGTRDTGLVIPCDDLGTARVLASDRYFEGYGLNYDVRPQAKML